MCGLQAWQRRRLASAASPPQPRQQPPQRPRRGASARGRRHVPSPPQMVPMRTTQRPRRPSAAAAQQPGAVPPQRRLPSQQQQGMAVVRGRSWRAAMHGRGRCRRPRPLDPRGPQTPRGTRRTRCRWASWRGAAGGSDEATRPPPTRPERSSTPLPRQEMRARPGVPPSAALPRAGGPAMRRPPPPHVPVCRRSRSGTALIASKLYLALSARRSERVFMLTNGELHRGKCRWSLSAQVQADFSTNFLLTLHHCSAGAAGGAVDQRVAAEDADAGRPDQVRDLGHASSS